MLDSWLQPIIEWLGLQSLVPFLLFIIIILLIINILRG